MPTVKSLRQEDVDKIQIDEALVYVNYGETDQRLIGPTRGGGKFTGTQTIRDIEFDGRVGKTAGMQAIEEVEGLLELKSLCCSQEEIALALPGCRVTGTGDARVIKNPKAGVLSDASGSSVYTKNITVFAKLFDGKFKKITMLKGMNENPFTINAVQKAENEIDLKVYAHYPISSLNGDLYQIEEVSADPQDAQTQSEQSEQSEQT